MKILKFGGTSVGSAERIKHVAELINNDEKKIVVLSAVSGTTNALVELGNCANQKNKAKFEITLRTLREKYEVVISELFDDLAYQAQAEEYIENHFALIQSADTDNFTTKEERIFLAQGELMSTRLMHLYLRSLGVDAVLLPALEFMKTSDGEPDTDYIETEIEKVVNKFPNCKLFITQGYICMNEFDEIDNLKRGGSDYSASIIGAAIKADEIQIWTDIDGMHNNDPRIVDKTFPVHELSFEEAAELAYFGAKILHPASVLPAQKENIPVRLLNTMQPEKQGTLIRADVTHDKKITAIAAKDGIVAIKIRSSRMLLAYGFLRKVFEIFEKYRTPIDMITTSEVAISLTIDDTSNLSKILDEIDDFGNVESNENQTIICVVGRFLQDDANVAVKVLQILKDIPIRMISYGGSKYNISLLVHNDYKAKALQLLNDGLFFENAT
ncbi:aspartate kinase [Chondrinema litorale]|uniref:aspartate kinase n=1 Tax=Chondrinema litorale TaxID=2994555 RepID=UPI0025428EEF|nr:aspartate kinase [Chondrinema litorale]UZR93864.1 aspartate kinase [Chondrinema litorale]